jgi:hypothetical protein
MIPLLVLDTNIIREAHEPTLTALRRKGYRLSVNAIAIDELIGRASRGPSDREPTPGIFYGPARRIAPHLDGCCPVIPERGRLLSIVKADGLDRERMLHDELAFMRQAWEKLLRTKPDELIRVGARSAEQLDRDGEIYTKLNSVRGAVLKKPVAWQDVFAEMLPAFQSSWPPVHAERLNAILRVNALRASKMIADAPGRRNFRPNDTPDTFMLACVGLGAFFATNDKDLLRDVRDSGTYQSPWIRSMSEYLAAERLPACMPWGDEARCEAERFAAELGTVA